ncbi:MAG: phosphate acyltransferase [Candidatus Saccharibacteria bacterium]|nr:phosphate acyltransferase [Candidatus Saccharibacteria bacterium]
MKIVIPEYENPIIQEALRHFPELEVLSASGISDACEKVASGNADTMISGLDYSSRDVLIAYKNHLPLKSRFFSSCFVCKKDDQAFVLADGGVNKLPTAEQLFTIVEDSAKTYETYFRETPKIAMLSYSTQGSGGKNPDLEKIHFVINEIRKNHPDWIIDGEMQLDAAVNPIVAQKKIPNSKIQGDANVLIVPDLNSGNILYKSMEQFGGFTMAGPIIQGFVVPLADLSRGSSVKDTILTIDVVKKLHERN